MNIGEADDQEKKLCYEVETVREFPYHVDRVNVGEGCEAAVTVRTWCWWVMLRECGELYGRFHLRLKGTAYESDVRPAILYESEVW